MASILMNGDMYRPTKFGPNVLKIAVLGEAKCGKTTFIRAFVREHSPAPETSINGVRVYPCKFRVNDEMRTVALYEIPSDPRFSILQKAPHYEYASVFIFMYAIDDPESLQKLSTRWIPETYALITSNLVSVALFGNKNDLRNNQQVIDRLALNNQVLVSSEQTVALFPAHVDCSATMEISSLNPDDISNAFSIINPLIIPSL